MNDHLSPSDFLTDFLLEQIAVQPLERRVLLYRAVAAETPDKALREDCRARAREIEMLLRAEHQMLLKFRVSRKFPDEGV
jgi:hypothetical protein